MASTPAHRLIRASDLKRQRAWTDTLIASLLGAPDALSPNPHGWRAPMRWYREDRVLDAEAGAAFALRAERVRDTTAAWRRDLPTRTFAASEVEHLEWLDDPGRIALFHAPRRPRMRRPRAAPAAAPVLATGERFEVLRLFDPSDYAAGR